MTRDEILAAIDAQQARLDHAVTLIEAATAMKAAAEANIETGTNQRADAQAEIVRLLEQLANLPRDFDPTADHHAPADRHGIKVVGGPTHALRVPPFETRAGRKARTIHVFEGKQPLTYGKWDRLAAALDSFPDRQHLAAWNTGDGANARGKSATPAQIEAGARRLRESIDTDRPRLRRMWENRIALGHVGQIIDRPNHECNGYPFDWAFTITPLPNIAAAEAQRLSILMADSYQAWYEFVLDVAAEVFGARYGETRWSFNLAGGGTGRPGAADLVRRAWPRNMPAGTRMVLSFDHYFKDLGSADHLARCIDVVDELAAELPNVVAIGLEETGGHLPGKMPAGQIPALKTQAARYGQILADWVASDRDISHVCWFETEDPNEQGATGDFTRVWLDPELVGPLSGMVTGADGRPFRSGYPQIAARFIERIAALR